VGKPNSFGLLTSLCGWAFQVQFSKNLIGDQDLSLFEILLSFYQALPCGFIASTSLFTSSSSSHFAWCFPCVSFSVWSSYLVACLGNPIFLVGVRMVACLFHATHLKEVGNPKFIQNITLCNETHIKKLKYLTLKCDTSRKFMYLVL
jgi:hypothetical protein